MGDDAPRLDDLDLVAMVAGALCAEAARRDEEQSPYGLDALAELALHEIVAEGLRAQTTLGVRREERYPAARAQRRRSQGRRCDLVLTPEPGQRIADPNVAPDLFSGAPIEAPDALWLEIKVAHQHGLVNGAAGPNPRYAQQLLTGAVEDLVKLAQESALRRAGAVVILFAEDLRVAEHDAEAFAERVRERGVAARSIQRGFFPIADRLGNGVAGAIVVMLEPYR